MTAKNRHKNNSSDKSTASIPEDASKKSPKSSTSNGVVEEIRETSAKHEDSARQNAELSSKMESVVQQVESLRSIVDGLESSLGITRMELEGAVTRMKRGEVETRKVDEALQKLQNNLLRDLSDGISEVKEARERDFSSLEKTVEERLAEVSQSITGSMTEFTEAQGVAQSQLADLKARLGDMEDPTLIKQELSAIVNAVAEIKTASAASDAAADSLRQQIGAVREELQTRNNEVASLSQEVETVRSVAQEHVGSLRLSLSEAEVEVQTLKDKSETLESSLEQAADAVRNVEKQASEAAAQVKKTWDDLEARVKATEESGDSLSTAVSDISTRVESLFGKFDTHESTLTSQGQTVEKIKTGLEQELESLKGRVEEVKSSMDTQTQQTLQVSDFEKRIATLEGGGKVKPEQLQSLTSMVEGLEAKAAKLEGHDKAIAALQKSLQDTTKTLAGLSKTQGKKGK